MPPLEPSHGLFGDAAALVTAPVARLKAVTALSSFAPEARLRLPRTYPNMARCTESAVAAPPWRRALAASASNRRGACRSQPSYGAMAAEASASARAGISGRWGCASMVSDILRSVERTSPAPDRSSLR
jgi:hypothetical protein